MISLIRAPCHRGLDSGPTVSGLTGRSMFRFRWGLRTVASLILLGLPAMVAAHGSMHERIDEMDLLVSALRRFRDCGIELFARGEGSLGRGNPPAETPADTAATRPRTPNRVSYGPRRGAYRSSLLG